MIKILVVVPYHDLYEHVETCLAEADVSEFSVELAHYVGTKDEFITNCDADIVVARGITSKAFACRNKDIHLVEIAVTGRDLITSLWISRQQYGSRLTGIIVTDPSICSTQQLQDLTGIPLIARKAEDENQVYESIAELYNQGVSAFIGGLTLCQKCEELGLPYVHIKTGKEAIGLAIQNAVTAARSLNRERARANLVTALLNNTEDVMFAVNKDGAVIAANTKASIFFHNDPAAVLVGSKVETFYADSRWKESLVKEKESEIMHSVADQLMLVKHVPIMVKNEGVGVLVTCKNVEDICRAEHKIRKTLSSKGLVAYYTFGDIQTDNSIMKMLIASAFKYSQVDSNVLIFGETGTGKELFAQSIHNASTRSSFPFVAVNCAALPEQLLESELFGYTEGSFSGAMKGGKLGLFELAHGGTIFLDEIGEMPVRLQAKILRVLQEREIRRIGGDTVVPVDVRIISATNICIPEKIEQGEFREDLFYRINVLNIKIPPLRERPEDVIKLFRHFAAQQAAEMNRAAPVIAPQVLTILKSHRWKGNIRELRNLSERLVLLSEQGMITAQQLEYCYLADDWYGNDQQRQDAIDPIVEQFERSGMRRKEFAEKTGVSRTTLWRKLKARQP